MGLVVGAVYGWNRARIVYRSEGLIQIAYTLPAVMVKTDQNEPMQMYEEFVQSQVLLIEGKDVLSDALKRHEWSEGSAGGSKPVTAEQFAEQLVVEHPPRTQAIRVTYLSPIPDAAAAGVRAVIGSYLKLAGDRYSKSDVERLTVLNKRRDALTTQIDTILKTISEKSVPITANEIAMSDDLMREYIKQLDVVQSELGRLGARSAGSANPTVLGLQAQESHILTLINQYVHDYQNVQRVKAAAGTSGAGLMPEYQVYASSLSDLRNELETVNHRIESLELERSLAENRTTVISHGDIPTSPYKDQRLLFAAAGGIAGMLPPVLVISLLGLISGRLRYSDEAGFDTHNVSLLGILPLIDEKGENRLAIDFATHLVNQLRLRLQLMGRMDKRVFMITSSTSGEGKTSLTTALGLSFAKAGTRTLLIDSDIIGRSLSFRLCATHEPGLRAAVAEPEKANFKAIVENLWLLPAGRRDEFEQGSLSPGAMDRLLTLCRNQFDVVLIDSGPILASLDASAVALSADSVIVAISQGQQVSVVKRSFHLLRSINADIAGHVFNKAVPADYGRTMDQSSSRYLARARRIPGKNQPTRLQEFSFGPLAATGKTTRTEAINQGGK